MAKRSPLKVRSRAVHQQRNPRKDLVLEELLNKAAQLFFDKGYANTRMQDIADAIGMSRPALYHYFKNKDEVLIALTEGDALTYVHVLEDLTQNTKLSSRERLNRAIRDNIEGKLQGSARFRFADRIQAELPPQLVASFASTRRRVFSLTSGIIQDGIERGEFRKIDSKIAAFAVLGMSNWTAWWFSSAGRKSPSEIAQDMADLVIHGLLSDRPGAVSAVAESALHDLEKATFNLKRALNHRPARREIK